MALSNHRVLRNHRARPVGALRIAVRNTVYGPFFLRRFGGLRRRRRAARCRRAFTSDGEGQKRRERQDVEDSHGAAAMQRACREQTALPPALGAHSVRLILTASQYADPNGAAPVAKPTRRLLRILRPCLAHLRSSPCAKRTYIAAILRRPRMDDGASCASLAPSALDHGRGPARARARRRNWEKHPPLPPGCRHRRD